jgi:hypothetical protein
VQLPSVTTRSGVILGFTADAAGGAVNAALAHPAAASVASRA